MANDAWFYAKGDQQSGPIPFEQLRSLARAGQLRPEDPIWTEGMTDWSAAATIPSLFDTPPINVSSPPVIPINYYAPTSQIVYAGFWLRFCAAVVDIIFLWIGTAIFSFAIALPMNIMMQHRLD